VTVKASPVEPDVRVELQNTLSLGEDRTVLAANATWTSRGRHFPPQLCAAHGIGRGIHQRRGLESLDGIKSNDTRIITLHLRGKTIGQQQFAVSLTGPV